MVHESIEKFPWRKQTVHTSRLRLQIRNPLRPSASRANAPSPMISFSGYEASLTLKHSATLCLVANHDTSPWTAHRTKASTARREDFIFSQPCPQPRKSTLTWGQDIYLPCVWTGRWWRQQFWKSGQGSRIIWEARNVRGLFFHLGIAFRLVWWVLKRSESTEVIHFIYCFWYFNLPMVRLAVLLMSEWGFCTVWLQSDHHICGQIVQWRRLLKAK